LAVPQASTAATLARMAETGLLPEGERLAAILGLYAASCR
jgi:hypothetical protein